MLTVPARVRFVKVATPLIAASPVAWLPPMVLVPEDVTVIKALLVVTMLPATSSTFTTGAVVRRAALAPPTGCVMIASLLPAPTAMATLREVPV